MPLRIIHQDITTLHCDAIVNPTDFYFSGGGGTDRAIHRAAGPKLHEECDHLPQLNQSEIAVTKGYDLPCRYVFHTMGPIWVGGSRNESALLRACYLNALFKAAQMGIKSIAFPLISSGTFGFPKDKVLQIALGAIGNFLTLLDADLDVTICIIDPAVYELGLSFELEQYLQTREPEPPAPCVCYAAAPISEEYAEEEEADFGCALMDEADAPEGSLDEWLKQQDDTFAVTLLKLIDKKNMTDVQCYKKANVTRKTFWKIVNDPKYKPSKPTIIAFAVALELTLDETEDLLRTVGFSLSHSNTFDMIISFYIRRGVYDVYEINSALYKYDQLCLGC